MVKENMEGILGENEEKGRERDSSSGRFLSKCERERKTDEREAEGSNSAMEGGREERKRGRKKGQW